MEEGGRWWFATLWLWLMVIFNALTALALAASLTGYVDPVKTPVAGQLYALLASVLQIGCVFAIFSWHRWGWWSLLGIGLITFCVNVAVGNGILLPAAGLVGIGLTYLVLRGGGQSAVWPRLR